MNDLRNTIAHILEHKQHLADANEATMQQYVVLPILRALGWDDANLTSMEILPEYQVESRRADYALHIKRGQRPVVLIECKRWGQPIGKNDEQICFYAYSGNIPLAIITNGKLWRFYLSRKEALSLSDRIFCETNIENREDAISDLEKYLLKSNVASGEAEVDAEIAADKPKGRTKFTKTQIKAVALQCWWKRTSRSRLATDNGLTEDQVEELRDTAEYREAVVSLMVGQRSDPSVFADWHKKESIKPEWMAGRMGLDVKFLPAMFKDAKAIHAEIVAGKRKAIKYIPSPDGKVTEYKVSDDGKITSKRVPAG